MVFGLRRVFAFSLSTVVGYSVYDAHKERIWCTAEAEDASEAREKLRLKHVVMLTRHGDRTPITLNLGKNCSMTPEERTFWHSKLPSSSVLCYLADLHPVKSKQYVVDITMDEISGQLTEKGLMSSIAIGNQLREKYVEEHRLLPKKLQPEHFAVRSTDYRRTIQTAQSILWGLYPDGERAEHNQIPIVVAEPAQENMVIASTACPRERELLKLAMIANAAAATAPYDLNILGESLRHSLGIEGRLSWLHVAEVLICRQAHKYPFPHGITAETVEQVKDVTSHLWSSYFDDRELCRLTSGRLIGDMLHHLELSRFDRSPVRFSLFSAHDGTVLALLSSLKVSDRKWPEYNAYVTVELYEGVRSKSHFVKLLYNGNEVRWPNAADNFVPFEEFEKVARELIPVDFPKECQAKTQTPTRHII